MPDEPLWRQARVLSATLRRELADDPRWCVWGVEPVRRDDGQVVPMVLLQDRQNGTFHPVPNRAAWTALYARSEYLFRTEN